MKKLLPLFSLLLIFSFGCDGESDPTTANDGSILGCIDSLAKNYDPLATKDDGSCEYDVYGCTDPLALNYNPDATMDDGSCEYSPASVQDQFIGSDFENGEHTGTVQFQLSNVGGLTAYNVKYYIETRYSCVGDNGQQWGHTYPEPNWDNNNYNYIDCCDIEPGETVELENTISGFDCSNGIDYFQFISVHSTWDH